MRPIWLGRSGLDVVPPRQDGRAAIERPLVGTGVDLLAPNDQEAADEIDAELDARLAAADELEARWRRGQHLLSS